MRDQTIGGLERSAAQTGDAEKNKSSAENGKGDGMVAQERRNKKTSLSIS